MEYVSILIRKILKVNENQTYLNLSGHTILDSSDLKDVLKMAAVSINVLWKTFSKDWNSSITNMEGHGVTF